MKKSKIIKVGAITLGVVLLLSVLFRNHSPFGKGNTSFASEAGREITRIEFSDGSQKLCLEKEGEIWLINGKSEARKSGILYILRVVQEQKIKSPVSDDLFQKEIAGKGTVPVKVKVYQKRKLAGSFIVYKTASNKYGNIMKKREGAKPFIVSVPGFEGDIGSVFTLNALYWEPFTVFNLLPSEIVSVSFQNFSDPASSFSIGNKNNRYTLAGPGNDISVFDSTRVTRYLSYFARIPLENWAFELTSAEKKEIESDQPLCRITVRTKEETTTELTLWERMTGEGADRKKDTDRLLGKTGKSDEFFIMRYFDIDPLLKKRSYFVSH
jgi:hypothetical protein